MCVCVCVCVCVTNYIKMNKPREERIINDVRRKNAQKYWLKELKIDNSIKIEKK